jgi:WhiB family transcriptional regulator, redox-sensing transcriptional regulator
VLAVRTPAADETIIDLSAVNTPTPQGDHMTEIRVDVLPRPAPSGTADWRDQGACLRADPELFFPVGNAGQSLLQLDQAKRVCARCTVATACLEWAMASGQEAGVWGGLSEDERRALRRMRRLPAFVSEKGNR